MKRGQILLIAAGLVVAFVLAFFLQDAIRRAVVTPLAYIWWVLKLFYAAIPQLFLWILLLVGLVMIITPGLVNWNSDGQPYEQPFKPAQGPVETLAGWVSNSREGNYFKWKIANRLGKLNGDISGRKDALNLPDQPEAPRTPGQLPPEAVQRYLKAGLDESFVDYPLPKFPFLRRQATPFDLDIDKAVEFLESQMKDHRELP